MISPLPTLRERAQFLPKKGHSRDHPPDRPQAEIGLLVNGDGIPISHTVFDGGIKDSTTLPQIVEQMRGPLKIKQCIFVLDKRMVTSENLREFASSGYEYIVSIKPRHFLPIFSSQNP